MKSPVSHYSAEFINKPIQSLLRAKIIKHISQCSFLVLLRWANAIQVWVNAIKVWTNAIKVWVNAIKVWAVWANNIKIQDQHKKLANIVLGNW